MRIQPRVLQRPPFPLQKVSCEAGKCVSSVPINFPANTVQRVGTRKHWKRDYNFKRDTLEQGNPCSWRIDALLTNVSHCCIIHALLAEDKNFTITIMWECLLRQRQAEEPWIWLARTSGKEPSFLSISRLKSISPPAHALLSRCSWRRVANKPGYSPKADVLITHKERWQKVVSGREVRGKTLFPILAQPPCFLRRSKALGSTCLYFYH